MRNKCFIILILWFSFFDTAYAETALSLEACKKLALQNNIRMQNGTLAIKSAEKVKAAAFTKYFPKVSAGALSFRSNEPLLKESIPGGNLPVYDGTLSGLLTASEYAYFPGLDVEMLEKGEAGYLAIVQPLFAGGRITNGNRLAALGKEVSILQKKMAEDDVLLRTEEQYFKIVSLNEKMKTILRYEAFLARLFEQVEDAFNNGISLKNDVLKVRQKKSEVELNKSKLENGIHLASMAFCQYIGLSCGTDILLTDQATISPHPEIYHVNSNDVIADRAEYRLLDKSVAAEKLATKLKKGEYLPEIGVGAAAIYMKFDDRKEDNNAMVYATASIPLSDWWEAGYSLKEREIREKIKVNERKDQIELLLVQMEKAWRDVEDAYKRLGLSETSSAQAEENLNLSKDSYVNGIVDISDLLEAQAIFQQSEDELIEAKTNCRLALSRYLQMTGRDF